MNEAPRNSMRTPLGKVRNLGASGGGTDHFIGQRASAIALVVLGAWFVLALALGMRSPGYVDAIDFLTAPINAVGVVLVMVIGLYHMKLGVQVVIEDYIRRPATKISLLLLSAFFPLAIVAGAIFAVLLINFGA